ncbi:protein FAM200B-like [Tachypleus tridentatus]|uniref:protein FAM200B-like n=1 Tax=Tachypleus tridentatus TaxID=6853 RepID=UPI003FD306BE
MTSTNFRLPMDSAAKKKRQQYSTEYLACSFIPLSQDSRMPVYLIHMATLSNESIWPCKLWKHLETPHKDKKEKPLDYFKKLRDNFQTRTTVK